jgi:hypothetical protein
MNDMGYVIVGAPIYRGGTFVIDKFLENQKEIQNNYPSSELVLATEQKDFIEELRGMLRRWDVRGTVILFEVVKPDYARAQNWHTTCGREAIRQYIVSETEASHLLFIDADMTCDPHIINILKKDIEGCDIVTSGYPGHQNAHQSMPREHLQHYDALTGGTGCLLITRDALKRIVFRCIEFNNHRVIDESEVLEMDSYSAGLKLKQGYFLTIDHYSKDGNVGHIEPHPVSLLRKTTNSRLLRYILLKASVKCKCNIPNELYKLRSRFF